MKIRNITIFVVVLLLIDQVVKILVKTHFALGECVPVCGDWFKLLFIENNGAAFGMQITAGGGFDWGKLLLSLFRIVLIGGLGYYIYYLCRKRADAPKGVIIALTLIFAGAIGNMIDSAFYGLIFTQSTPLTIAQFGTGYGSFMMGRVVDMLYFPLFQWNSCPDCLSFLLDANHNFFGPIFNIADSYISVAFCYLLFFQYKFFK